MSTITCMKCNAQCSTSISYSQWGHFFCSKKCHRLERDIRMKAIKLAEEKLEEERKKNPIFRWSGGDDIGGPGMT